jgi:hypothetical protein
MQSVLTDWTVVIAGTWNAGIFLPPWVSANVFDGQNVNMEIALGAISPVLRYNCGLTTLIVQPEMIIGSVREATAPALAAATSMLLTILEKLPHTPITAVGINFGFREEHPNEGLLNNFEIADNQKLIDLGGEVSQTTIQRDIKLDGGLLKLKETIEESGAVHFHLNFHYEAAGAPAAGAVLTENGANRHARALELMNAVYGLQPE